MMQLDEHGSSRLALFPRLTSITSQVSNRRTTHSCAPLVLSQGAAIALQRRSSSSVRE